MSKKQRSAPTIIAGQPSWQMANDDIELALTCTGGHMAPVTFYRGSKQPIAPYYISPWQNSEDLPPTEPVLRMLRGDFFCLPFGANPPHRGKRCCVHGEPATRAWKLEGLTQADGLTRLTATMAVKYPAGRVTKELMLIDGHQAVYSRHILSGFQGAFPLGHHATLATGHLPDGALRLSTSPLRWGWTGPRDTLAGAGGEYNALAPNRRFRSLARVPTIWQAERTTDCARFPAREGFCDILTLCARPTLNRPAWTCAAWPEGGYLWFAFKNPALLPSTVLWMEHRGRHSAPWNGRNSCLGIEEVCAYHTAGLGASIQANDLSAAGVPTALRLNQRRATTIPYIQGVARIPRSFDRVKAVTFAPGAATFQADSGKSVRIPVRHEFLFEAPPVIALSVGLLH